MLFEGYAGRFVQKAAGIITAGFSGLGSMRVAQVEGDGDEATRAGLRFYLGGFSAAGVAPVQALMSTAAQWMIWNPNGNTYTAFVDILGVALLSGTAGAGGTLHWCPVPPKFAPATVPTVSTSGITIVNANPVSGRQSNLIVVSGQTLVNAVAGNWQPLAWMNPAGTVLGQTQLCDRDIKGKICIPPGCGVALAVISPTGTSPLFVPFGQWREYAADVE